MAEELRVVLITAPDLETARRLARAMVTARLAACVNLVPGVWSIYGWEGEVQEESEVLLVAKTLAAQVPELQAFLGREHPYDTPECVALEPADVAPAYARWLLDWTGPAGEPVSGDDGQGAQGVQG